MSVALLAVCIFTLIALHHWSAYCISTLLAKCIFIFGRQIVYARRCYKGEWPLRLVRAVIRSCLEWLWSIAGGGYNFSFHYLSMHGVPFTQQINCQVGLTNEKLSLRRLCVFRIWMFGSTCSRYYAFTPIKDYSICVSSPLHTCQMLHGRLISFIFGLLVVIGTLPVFASSPSSHCGEICCKLTRAVLCDDCSYFSITRA